MTETSGEKSVCPREKVICLVARSREFVCNETQDSFEPVRQEKSLYRAVKTQSGRGTCIPPGGRKGVTVSCSCGKELDTSTKRAEGRGIYSLGALPRNELVTHLWVGWEAGDTVRC